MAHDRWWEDAPLESEAATGERWWDSAPLADAVPIEGGESTLATPPRRGLAPESVLGVEILPQDDALLAEAIAQPAEPASDLRARAAQARAAALRDVGAWAAPVADPAAANMQRSQVAMAAAAGRVSPSSPVTSEVPAVEEDPEGTAIGRAVRRGGLRVASSLPAFAASSDIRALGDAGETDAGLAAQTFHDITGQWPTRGQDVSTPEAAAATIEAMGYPPNFPALFREVYERRRGDAGEARQDPERFEERAVTNVRAADRLLDRAQRIQFSPQGQRIQAEMAAAPDTLGDTLRVIARNPGDFGVWMTEVAAESLPAIGASAVASLATGSPTTGLAVMGAGAMAQEYGAGVDEFLAERGIEIETEEDAVALVNDPTLMADANSRGLGRGVVIAAFEMAGQGASARSFFRSPMGSAVVDAAVQASTGAGGEAAARAVTGQEFSAREVLIEGLAELVTAPLEVGAAAIGREGSSPRPGPTVDRPDSSRLTAEDRASPLPNDLIDDGKAALDNLLAGAPQRPQTFAPGLPPSPLGDSRVARPGGPASPLIRQPGPAPIVAPAAVDLSPVVRDVLQDGGDDVDLPEGAVPASALYGEPEEGEAAVPAGGPVPDLEAPQEPPSAPAASIPAPEAASPATEAPTRRVAVEIEGEPAFTAEVARVTAVGTVIREADGTETTLPAEDIAGGAIRVSPIRAALRQEEPASAQAPQADALLAADEVPVPGDRAAGEVAGDQPVGGDRPAPSGVEARPVRGGEGRPDRGTGPQDEAAAGRAGEQAAAVAGGAPVEVGTTPTSVRPAPPSLRPIRRDRAVTPAGRDVEVEYAVIEADELTASNIDDGRVNPAFPQERQPRDRSRGTSALQVRMIANTLNPRLLDTNASTTDGAPVIDAGGIVESGNGRVMAIRRAYAEVPVSAARYREHLASQGYPVAGMREPVLVRVRRSEMPEGEVAAFTRESNERTTAAMSAPERAMADAQALPDAVLSLYRGGDVDQAGNREFVRAFVGAVVGEADRGQMIDASGAMSQDAVRRVQGALLAKAYGDAALVAKVMESSDSGIRAIGGALLDVAPRWAQLRAEAKAGTVAPAMDQTAALLEAVTLVDRARTSGRNVAEFTAQPDLLTGEGLPPMGRRFLELMFRDTRQWTKPAGRDRLAEALGYYVDEALKSAPGADMFGSTADPDAVAAQARRRQDGPAQGQQGDLLARPAPGDGTGVPPAQGDRAGRGEPPAADQVGDERADRGDAPAVDERRRAGGAREQAQPLIPRQVEAARWKEEVAHLFGGERLPPDLDLGPVHLVLRKLGGTGRRLVMSSGKAKTILRVHPEMTREVWERLPSLIENPEMVIDNSDGVRSGDLLFITGEQVPDGRLIVAAVQTAGSTSNRGTASVVVTAFAKTRLADTLAKAVREDKIVYLRARREGRGYSGIGAISRSGPLSGVVSDLRANPKIAVPEDFFKPKNREATAPSPLTNESAERIRAALPRLRLELDRLGLKSVRLAIDARIAAQGRFEVTADGDMGILIGASLDATQTLHHEAIHALRALDLFTATEWLDLERAAETDWIEKHDIEGRYPDLSREEQVEEAIAEEFAASVAEGRTVRRGLVGRALDKIGRLMGAVRGSLNGQGITRPEDVFGRVASGEVGNRRRPREPRATAKDQRPPAQRAQDETVSAALGEPLTHTVAPGMPAQARQEGFLRAMASQPIDQAFRLPFAILGGLDGAGRWKPGKAAYRGLSYGVTEMPMGFLSPIVERVRAGLIDRYGLDEAYVAREKRRTIDEALISAEGQEHLDALKTADVGIEEARVLHAMLTGEAVPEGDMAKLAQPIREAIDLLGAEAVELGLLSPEAFDRNRGKYLHRVYAKHEMDQGAMARWAQGFAAGRRRKIIGDQFKGRGMFMPVAPGEVVRNTDAMALARKRSGRLAFLEKRKADLMGRYEVAVTRLDERTSEMEAQITRRMGTSEASRALKRKGGATTVLKPSSFQKGQGREQSAALTRLQNRTGQAWALIQKLDGEIDAIDGKLMETEASLFAQGEVKVEKGQRFTVLEKSVEREDDRKSIRRAYVPEGATRPDALKGYEDRGVWEVRGTKGGKVILWRDFDKAERTRMGEILDARYAVAKTYAMMSRDLATGRFFRDIAENPAWSVEEPPEGAVTDQDPEFRRLGKQMWRDPRVQWVLVPDTKIAKTDTKRYGALGGRYVQAAIWRDMEELRSLQTPGFWNALLSQWKQNKTTRNPGTHVNNVMSNIMLMDMADVRVPDLVAGVRSLAKQDAAWREAMEAGAFGADLVSEEFRRNVLDPLLDEIKRDGVDGKGSAQTLIEGLTGGSRIAGGIGKMLDITGRGLGRADEGAMHLYQVEDQVFRMALFHRRRSQGSTVEAAAQEAREQFLDYDIRAPLVNAARRSFLPFISYTYRAIPRFAQMLAERPWKLVKFFTLLQAANMLAYGLAPSDDEEEEERRSMREDQQGITWTGVPRMVRMPWLSDDLPVFLDVRRWIPAGDVFDTMGSDMPAWLQVGGPLLMGMELYLNRSAFTGEDIVNPVTDTFGERMAGRRSYLWQQFMPSWAPGGHNFNNVARAWSGEALPYGSTRPYNFGEALSSAAGVKIAPHDVERGFQLHALEFDRIEGEIDTQASALKRQFSRRLIDRAEFDEGMDQLALKRERLRDRMDEVLP